MLQEKMQKHSWKRKVFFFLIILPALLLLMAFAVMLLWNAVLTYLIDVPEIDYLQALALLVLCKILFGRFGFLSGDTSNKNLQ